MAEKNEKQTNFETKKMDVETPLIKVPPMKKKFLIIQSGANENDTASVMIGINGYVYKIKRDEEVEVPESVINVLKDAVQQQPVQSVVNGQMQTTFRPVKRYSFSVSDTPMQKHQ